MFTVIIYVLVNHFNAENETEFSQSFQVIRMYNVRSEKIVEKTAKLVQIITKEEKGKKKMRNGDSRFN